MFACEKDKVGAQASDSNNQIKTRHRISTFQNHNEQGNDELNIDVGEKGAYVGYNQEIVTTGSF